MTIGARHTSAAQLSTDEWESRLGEQFRRARLDAGLDQAALAERADVSVGALRNLERGQGSTVKTLVRVARSLGRESWLGQVAPAVTVSPIDVLRSGRAPRQRVYRSRRPTPGATPGETSGGEA